MTPWQTFYSSVRDPSWPDCDRESDFQQLPDWIQQECMDRGYQPGQYQQQPALSQKRFPIETATACQLKWNWSTVFLTTETTASCHRTDQHRFDVQQFDFHNTPSKIDDRRRMLSGQWPQRGCDYCKKIEQAGGQSDRITNLDFPGIHAPPELDSDPQAVHVAPRILEVYFDNLCNLKCVYCGPNFSSLWEAENRRWGEFKSNGIWLKSDFAKSTNLEQNKQKLFAWFEKNIDNLTNLNILGGEPLYQKEFDDCLALISRCPAPNLDLQIFTNLNTTPTKLRSVIDKVQELLDQGKLRKFSVTASLDCWGEPQEYARFPLDLSQWEENFSMLLATPDIALTIGSTITPLTIKTLPDLVDRIAEWNHTRQVNHYFNSVNHPSFMCIDIFGGIFAEDFERALSKMSQITPEQKSTWGYLDGIRKQSISNGSNAGEVLKLKTFITELDRRRGTSWPQTFPWLVDQFDRVLAQ